MEHLAIIPIEEIWQMPVKEYMNQQAQKVSGPSVGKTKRMAKTYHAIQVRQAVKDGQPVPPEVLKDYPDLQYEKEFKEVFPKGVPTLTRRQMESNPRVNWRRNNMAIKDSTIKDLLKNGYKFFVIELLKKEGWSQGEIDSYMLSIAKQLHLSHKKKIKHLGDDKSVTDLSEKQKEYLIWRFKEGSRTWEDLSLGEREVLEEMKKVENLDQAVTDFLAYIHSKGGY